MMRVSVGLAAVFVLALACSGSAPTTAEGHGVVRSVDASKRGITIEHEDIPGVMDAMTMTFRIAPEVSLDGIAEGAQVDFVLRREAADFTITELRRSP